MIALPAPPFPSLVGDPAKLADWIELTAIARRRPITRGMVEMTMQRENVDDLDAKLASAWTGLNTRGNDLGARWALKFSRPDALCVRDARRGYLFHYFLCALSAESGVDADGRRLFEEAVADLVRGLGMTYSYRIGHDSPRELAPTFREAVEKYIALSREELASTLPHTDNDLGLDVVAWIDLDDPRCGSLHLLGQCATGANWNEKFDDLNLDVWANHVHWAVPPVRFLAVPHFLDLSPMHWRRSNNRGGILLDRRRLLQLYGKSPLRSVTKQRVAQFCEGLYH